MWEVRKALVCLPLGYRVTIEVCNLNLLSVLVAPLSLSLFFVQSTHNFAKGEKKGMVKNEHEAV